MAKLTDMYDQDEIPTRPDWPNTVATRCKHCGKVYGDHKQQVTPAGNADCWGIRRGFEPEEKRDGDRER